MLLSRPIRSAENDFVQSVHLCCLHKLRVRIQVSAELCEVGRSTAHPKVGSSEMHHSQRAGAVWLLLGSTDLVAATIPAVLRTNIRIGIAPLSGTPRKSLLC